jgi:6-pyruvoyltetrahydropterin/6-carboxytetrahydropterin synthase
LASASLTRRVSFSAAHRYSRSDWSDEKNAATFGACAWPNFHGHTYVCDVTVGGPIDEATGFVVDLGVLDDILTKQVKERFDHRNINLDVPEFGDGQLIPTGENLARFIFERVDRELPKPAKVMRVIVGEDDSLSATYSRE